MSVVNLPRELLDFYKELELLQTKFFRNVTLPQLEIAESILNEHYAQGVPLFSLVPFKIDAVLCWDIFREVCSLIKEKRPETGEQVKLLEEAVENTVDRLVEAYLGGEEKYIEEIVKGKLLSITTARFVLECTSKPFMKAYAQLVGSLSKDEDWQRNHCPVCGNKARYARINQEDNKRYLHCSLCEHRWLFKRLACPNCSNEDHNSLRTLFIEEIPGYQIHVCEKCRTYLKVFDSEKEMPENPGLIDAQTIFLDLMAQQKGYK